ncbi:MAG: RlpA-like double-psi beta-barrel domain-containing protein [Chloroflexota bacterium]|nr:RlpA-like double-psi beta-barrel domain-containing protein [Chloroflexota bacterium]
MRIVRKRRESGTRIVRLMLVTLAAVASGVPSLLAHPVAAAPAHPSSASPTSVAESASSVTFRVYATREGLVGGTTSSGHVITTNDHFVALPSVKALNKSVKISYKGRSATAPVLDIGPWNNDDDYWNPSDVRTYKGITRGVPQAKAAYDSGHNGGKSGTGLTVSAPGGIDIGDGTYADLGMGNPDYVDVTFLWMVDDGSASSAVSQPAPAAKTVSAPKPGLDLSNASVLGIAVSPPLDRATDLGVGYTFVAQTGHNMPDVIAKYWNAKGGVLTLGYPLSELFIRKADDGQHVYQYFERVLIEYVPDSNSVTLASLGAWFAEANGPYPTVAAFDNTAKKRFVAATGHGIVGGILQWYAANGDSDVFGAPLAEEGPYTTKDGRKVTAQLFERARIEMDASGNVTLGRLGAEWLAQRGWL